jgi:hypothetical protein
MTDDRSLERAARSWLEAGPTEAPDRAVEAALLRIQTTPQERDLRIPWRLPKMTTPARVATAAVIGVLAVGGALFMIGRLDQTGVGGPGPSPTATASPTPVPSPTPIPSPSGLPALKEGPLTAGTYVITPFAQAGSDACFDPDSNEAPPLPGCIDTTNDDSIRVTFTVPDGWGGAGFNSIGRPDEGNDPLGEASMLVVRGGMLLGDPCQKNRGLNEPKIPVGPTVDDFVSALDDHPLLDVTAPVDVTLAGYSGKYMDLQVPTDISGCDVYRPWDPWLYAQGPGHRWHLWILDVDGVRVIVQGTDYAGTSPEHQAELQSIVDSVQIER